MTFQGRDFEKMPIITKKTGENLNFVWFLLTESPFLSLYRSLARWKFRGFSKVLHLLPL